VPLGTSAHKEGAVVVVGTAQRKKNPEPQEDATSRALGRKKNGDTPLDCSGRTVLRREQCDEMPESRNSGIESEVDFLGNELLRQLHDNR
jgi:hypothetical protein